MQTPASEYELLTALLLWIRAHGAAERIVAASGEALALDVADRVIAEYRLAAERTTLARLFLLHAENGRPLITIDAADGLDAARVVLTPRGKERLRSPDRAKAALELQRTAEAVRARRIACSGDEERRVASELERLTRGPAHVTIQQAGSVQIGENRGVVSSVQVAGDAIAPGAETAKRPWKVKTWSDNVKAVVSLTSLAFVLLVAMLAMLGLIPGVDVGAWIMTNLLGAPK